MTVWTMIFIFRGAHILRFHVNLPECSGSIPEVQSVQSSKNSGGFTSYFHFTPVNQHGNGKWTLWRWISYWKWGYALAMLVYQRVDWFRPFWCLIPTQWELPQVSTGSLVKGEIMNLKTISWEIMWLRIHCVKFFQSETHQVDVNQSSTVLIIWYWPTSTEAIWTSIG